MWDPYMVQTRVWMGALLMGWTFVDWGALMGMNLVGWGAVHRDRIEGIIGARRY